MFNVIVWVRSQVCRHSPPHGYEIMIELRIRNVITYTFMSIIIMYVCNLTNVKLMVYIFGENKPSTLINDTRCGEIFFVKSP